MNSGLMLSWLRLATFSSSSGATTQAFSDEGKKARIAPGKLRSCIPWDGDTLIDYSGEHSCSMRAIQTVLACPACFLKRPCVPS